jgi:hypothetical protein
MCTPLLLCVIIISVIKSTSVQMDGTYCLHNWREKCLQNLSREILGKEITLENLWTGCECTGKNWDVWGHREWGRGVLKFKTACVLHDVNWWRTYLNILYALILTKVTPLWRARAETVVVSWGFISDELVSRKFLFCYVVIRHCSLVVVGVVLKN